MPNILKVNNLNHMLNIQYMECVSVYVYKERERERD